MHGLGRSCESARPVDAGEQCERGEAFSKINCKTSATLATRVNVNSEFNTNVN